MSFPSNFSLLLTSCQSVPFVDIDDDSRAANASSHTQKLPAKAANVRASTQNTKQTQLVSDLRGEIEQLKKQNAISNAIIKKLHKRNKELESKTPASQPNVEMSKSQMEEVIRENGKEIENLRKQATLQRPSSPLRQTSQLSSISLLQQRIKTLESDYKSLLGVKLECIAEGETTGKVNKEVKSFFTHLKTRLLTSERDWELERAMWQLRVYELETQK